MIKQCKLNTSLSIFKFFIKVLWVLVLFIILCFFGFKFINKKLYKPDKFLASSNIELRFYNNNVFDYSSSERFCISYRVNSLNKEVLDSLNAINPSNIYSLKEIDGTNMLAFEVLSNSSENLLHESKQASKILLDSLNARALNEENGKIVFSIVKQPESYTVINYIAIGLKYRVLAYISIATLVFIILLSLEMAFGKIRSKDEIYAFYNKVPAFDWNKEKSKTLDYIKALNKNDLAYLSLSNIESQKLEGLNLNNLVCYSNQYENKTFSNLSKCNDVVILLKKSKDNFYALNELLLALNKLDKNVCGFILY